MGESIKYKWACESLRVLRMAVYEVDRAKSISELRVWLIAQIEQQQNIAKQEMRRLSSDAQ